MQHIFCYKSPNSRYKAFIFGTFYPSLCNSKHCKFNQNFIPWSKYMLLHIPRAGLYISNFLKHMVLVFLFFQNKSSIRIK